jgi:hypothetical protein
LPGWPGTIAWRGHPDAAQSAGQAAYLLRGWGADHLIPKFQHLKAGEYLAGPALSWSRSVIALGSRCALDPPICAPVAGVDIADSATPEWMICAPGLTELLRNAGMLCGFRRVTAQPQKLPRA